MDNYQGDLTDIVRASGGSLGCGSGSPEVPAPTWPFTSDPINFSSSAADHRGGNCFGDPFIDMRDPLLHEVNKAGSGYFGSPNSAIDIISTGVEDTANRSFCGAGTDSILSQKMFEDDMKGPCNIFSRIQISQSPKQMAMSPCDSPVMAAPAAAATSPRGIKAPAGIPSDMISTNSSKGCLVDDTVPVQISSPRNLGIKRRKSQAKKVVCIPAPAAANSRSSGEVIPSDLWAWRKYGQKPIKGSPYPRGYYRCSSSKGCSARKQVERCKNDPSMLVITYTSEHNHPWPTQRNALAGSTRSQLSKNNAASKSSTSSQLPNPTNTKEEVKESSNDTLSPVVGASSSASQSVKEEIEEIEKHLEMDDAGFGEGSNQSYRPALPGSLQSEDFFADLDELDVDPLNLMFTQGFNEDQQKENKGLDPFSLFDWSGDNNNTSFGESNRVL